MVRSTKDGEINKFHVLQNAEPISELLLQRMEYTLQEYGIEYSVLGGEIKSTDGRVDKIYDTELEKLKNELLLNKGDYKKIKKYE